MPTSSRFPSFDDPEVLRTVVRHLRGGLYVADADGRLVDANPAFASLVGAASVADVVGQPLATLLAGADARGVTTSVLAPYDAGGRTYQLGTLGAAPREAGEAGDARVSQRDELTGAFGRGQLDLLARDVERRPDDGWACLYVDVDDFAAYNERHGRDAGDGILVRMARFLMRQVRADEPVIRLANDEFVVMLRGTTDGRTERIARRIQLTALRTAPAPFALGWAMRDSAESLDALVARAAERRVHVRVTERQADARGRDIANPDV